MINTIKREKQQISKDLQNIAIESRVLAKKFGLNPRPVRYWIIDNEEMNELISYGGFQKRYPHWRWGMAYDKQKKTNQYLGGKAYEIVNNDDPCHAFLQMSNTTADQKAVITHVEAHSDFFENNQWFENNPSASEMLAKHSDKIQSYMDDPDIDKSEVERWIDNIITIEDNIDQYSDYIWRDVGEDDEDDENSLSDSIDNLGLSKDVQDVVFDDFKIAKEKEAFTKEKDLIKYIINNGKRFDEESESAENFEDWQLEILDMIREEAYYFAPQKMTKIMNEGWAAIFEGWMMANETFADDDEVITYADHQSKVLNSPGLNPYKLGKELWHHIENTVNRREVVDKLLRIDGVTPDNFHKEINFQKVHDCLDCRDSEDILKRNYSLTRTQNQGFIQNIKLSELRKCYRYVFDSDIYDSIEEAISQVDYSRGWERMKEVRETHNDIMFIDEFLTQEFIDKHEYFSYEYRISSQRFEISSRDVSDVKKKLLLQFTNFGKPTIYAIDDNYNNSGELLLLHRYNGIVLDIEKAQQTVERMFEMWGRPINMATVGKSLSDEEIVRSKKDGREPEPEDTPVLFRYDGMKWSTHKPEHWLQKELEKDAIDYSTVPEEWS